jgi:hypothetical protein
MYARSGEERRQEGREERRQRRQARGTMAPISREVLLCASADVTAALSVA